MNSLSSSLLWLDIIITIVTMCSADIFLGLLALLFPPLPVWVKCGICSADSFINILLCVLGYIPGLIHAWYIIAKYPEPGSDYDTLPQSESEAGRVTYVIIHEDGRRSYRNQPANAAQPKPQQQNGMSYGTAGANGSSASAPAPAPAPAAAATHNAGEGSSDGAPPPSYAQVVAGDHKVQSQE